MDNTKPQLDPNYNPGGLKDREDSRDYQYKEVGAGVTTPFDWSVGFDIESRMGRTLPVKDQGGSYSCGGQAWSSYDSVLEFLVSGTFEERSAKYVYSQVYVPGGGSFGRDCANICINQGIAREANLTSYQGGSAPTEWFMERSGDITATIRDDAKSAKLYSYAQVGNNIDDIANAMKANSGIIIGITGSNNGTWLSATPKAPVPGESVWHHWVYAGKAKKINGVKHIGILNSWGKDTGENGWQWISESYAAWIWSAWTHIFTKPLSTTFSYVFNVDMKYGQTSADIKALQTALKIDGDLPATVNPTGYFGLVTLSAVKSFQRKYGIAKFGEAGYGLAGPKTRAKLNSIFT